MALVQTSVKNNKSYQLSGFLGAGAAIGWTGTVTESVAAVAGIPYSGAYNAYYGSLASLTGYVGAGSWSNASLLGLGAPGLISALGVWGSLLNTTAVATIGYSFTSAVPAGASFMLVDPGASYPSFTGAETFKISATYKGVAVSTSGWSFSLQSPTSGKTYASGLTIDAASGTITVSAYAAAAWPDAVVVITPNTPISSLSVTASTIPYDFWALTLPHIPSALVLQSGNAAAAFSGVISLWQFSGLSVTGGGGITNPGSIWHYAGQGDFTGDGSTSILFRNSSGVLAYWGLSGTTITYVGTIGGPGGTWSVIGVGDLNGDGHSDILFEDATQDLAVWEMNGAAIIGGGALYSLGGGWRYVATADLNGDGRSDLLFQNTSGLMAEWLMNGTTVASVVTNGAAPAGAVFAGVGDFNGDGISDVLFKNPALGQYSAWLLTSSGTVASTVTLCTPGPNCALASIGAYTVSSASDLVFENTTTGMLTEYIINNAKVTSVGDIGAPGANAWVATTPHSIAPPKPTVYFGDTSGNLAFWFIPFGVFNDWAFFPSALTGWTFVAGGDFSGYGRPDFLARNASGNYAVFETSGSQIVGGGSIGNPGAGWTYKGVGDFNGDGVEDILFQDSSGNLGAWLLNGGTVLGSSYMGTPDPSYTLATIGDFNGDGTSDLLYKDSGGNYAMFFYANAAYVGGVTIGNPGAGYTLLGAGDFNGDGRADLLFQGASNIYKTWDLNGAAIVGGGTFSGPSANSAYFGIADIGGNGCASILFRDPSSGYLVADTLYDATVVSTLSLGAPNAGFTPLAVI